MPTPVIPRSLSRRAVLRLSAGAIVTTVALPSTSGCSSQSDPEVIVDTLTAHLRLADRDASAAGAAIATLPGMAGTLEVVRSERSAHANALDTEIRRVTGESKDVAASTASPTTPAAPPPTLDELKAFLFESQRSAADSARNESGYRAGLLGSISAACAVQSGMVLS